MEENGLNKVEISALIVLFVGVALLLFTFLNAYWFLIGEIGLFPTSDLVEAFGEALAPLIATCIRVMYLGIMGWIGSLLTLRGISLLKQKEVEKPVIIEKRLEQKSPAAVPEEKPKKKEKPSSPPPSQTEIEPKKTAPMIVPSSENKAIPSTFQEASKPSPQPPPQKEEKEEQEEKASQDTPLVEANA